MSKSPKPAAAAGESLSFEAALAELEELVAGMESGQLRSRSPWPRTSAGSNLRSIARPNSRRPSSKCRYSKPILFKPSLVPNKTIDSVAWMGAVQARMETALERFLPAPKIAPARLHQAMRYAVLGGGKRVRPLLASPRAN